MVGTDVRHCEARRRSICVQVSFSLVQLHPALCYFWLVAAWSKRSRSVVPFIVSYTIVDHSDHCSIDYVQRYLYRSEPGNILATQDLAVITLFHLLSTHKFWP